MTDKNDDILAALYAVIQERKQADPGSSYVASLYHKGLDKILGKIGEEATETAIAGKAGDLDQVIYETLPAMHATVLNKQNGKAVGCVGKPEDLP